MKLKKVLSAITALALVSCSALSMSGCGESNDGKYTVGICQLTQHVALDSATEGFKDALTEKLGEENITFDYKNASGEDTNCTTIVNQFVSNKVDLIMANATPALQAAHAATDAIPIVATSITDYATALDMDSWNGKTGINVTGSCDLAPLEQQAAMLKELLPDAKSVGILYCSGEANSKYQATEITKAFTDLGLTVTEFTFADSNDIASVVTNACDRVDVIYIPTDNTAADCTETINSIAEPAKIPIIAGESGICTGCGIATLSIDYYDLGYKAGEMAYEILVNGTDPAEMEIEYSEELTKQYMADRCTALGVTVPDTYTAIEVAE